MYRLSSFTSPLRVITLTLLHPVKQSPVQVWTFPHEAIIRIGRSTDNQVVLYSAVVSRHHVELHRVGAQWKAINLGTNGTYLDGKRITEEMLQDGAVIRLARSGPNIQIRLGEVDARERSANVPTPRSQPTPANAQELAQNVPSTHELPFIQTDIIHHQGNDDRDDPNKELESNPFF